jgi:hypothetical protein
MLRKLISHSRQFTCPASPGRFFVGPLVGTFWRAFQSSAQHLKRAEAQIPVDCCAAAFAALCKDWSHFATKRTGNL